MKKNIFSGVLEEPSMNKEKPQMNERLEEFEEAFPVYKTNDLTRFVVSDFNRDIVPNEKLRKSLISKGFDLTMPLKVIYEKKTGLLYLTDGHHRYIFCCDITSEKGEELSNSSLTVSFIIIAVVNDIHDIDAGTLVRLTNQTAKAWNPDAYTKSYAASGFPAYTSLQDEILGRFEIVSKNGKKKPRYRAGTPLITATHGRVLTQDAKFKEGELKPTDVDMPFAIWVLNYILNQGISTLFSKRKPQEILVKFFTFFYPLFSADERNAFDEAIKKYAFPYLGRNTDPDDVIKELISLPFMEYSERNRSFGVRSQNKHYVKTKVSELFKKGCDWFGASKGIEFKSDMSMYPEQKDNRN